MIFSPFLLIIKRKGKYKNVKIGKLRKEFWEAISRISTKPLPLQKNPEGLDNDERDFSLRSK